MEAEKLYTIDTNAGQTLMYYVFDGSKVIETPERPEGDGKTEGPRYLARPDFWDQMAVKYGIYKDEQHRQRKVG